MSRTLRRMFFVLIIAAASAPLLGPIPGAQAQGEPPAPRPPSPVTTTADHSQFKILQQDFASGPDVTKACLSCHNAADDEVMHTIHFSWDYQSPSGQTLGKSHVINAFCGNVVSNEPRCTSCHAGYGWDDMNAPPPEQASAVDCLVCHDRSGQYTKSAAGAGMPPLFPVAPGTKTITGALAWPVNLSLAAQSAGNPGRDNCGNCHFYGGGGDNVKHGDLSSVLYQPALAVDVHMSPEGEDFTCATCHVSERHDWSGSRYDLDPSYQPDTSPGAPRSAVSCQSCHGTAPHRATLVGLKLNDHGNVLACQSCHIPEFARGGAPTKTFWDWSTAGRLGPDGRPIAESGYTSPTTGREFHTYLSQKGNFEWGEDVAPLYAWFDGHLEYTLPEQRIDPDRVVEINHFSGARQDGQSRIWPFKQMRGRQAYDAGFNKLAYSNVWGPDTDTAFWTNFDWSKAIEAGMAAAGSPYSGEYGFVDTHMYWPITHMVAPASDAVSCEQCHSEEGRMVGLASVYLPGTNPRSPAGLLGRLLVAAALIGVFGHALVRLRARKRARKMPGAKGGDHG